MASNYGEDISNNLNDIRSQIQALTRQLEIGNRLALLQMLYRGLMSEDIMEYWSNIIEGEREA
jgi:uncharacterized tellurite resistance protein B-like protein